MRGYVALSWTASDVASRSLARAIQERAVSEGFRAVEVSRCAWVGVQGPRPPAVHRPRTGCLVIGEVFGHPAPLPGHASVGSDLEVANWYACNRWGRYILLFQKTGGGIRAIFRDPSGALEALNWKSGGVQVVAAHTPDWLMAAAPPKIGFDWDRLSQLVASPFTVDQRPAIRGLASVAAGELMAVSGDRKLLWRPEAFAQQPVWERRKASEGLRETLDLCVSALAGQTSLGVELSGGLDSSIIGGTLGDLGKPVNLALNTRSDRVETDEQAFAEAVAGRLGMTLTRRERLDIPYTADLFEATADGPVPSQNGRDLTNDRVVVDACQEAGVTTLMTGKGGDALFFQMPTPLAFADLWWRRPLRGLGSALLPGTARWTRTSTWSVLASARESRRVSGATELPPAKLIQLDAIKSGMAYYSRCLRTEAVDMVHPLMAQPLVEWALRTPVPLLVSGGRDRALARKTFADRLPEAVATRQGKGDYGTYFNRQVAANLPFLRSYLLDGRLASEGVLDRTALEPRLQADALRWQGGAPEILSAVSTEAWVRRWARRGAR